MLIGIGILSNENLTKANQMQQIDTTALDAINQLQRPGKPSLLVRIIDVFNTDAPLAIDSIVDAAAVDDFETIAKAAHSLKSSSAYIGANDLVEKLKAIEVAAKASDSDTCKSIGENLKEQSESVLSELQIIRDKAA